MNISSHSIIGAMMSGDFRNSMKLSLLTNQSDLSNLLCSQLPPRPDTTVRSNLQVIGAKGAEVAEGAKGEEGAGMQYELGVCLTGDIGILHIDPTG